MSELTVVDSVHENGQTSVLLHEPPEKVRAAIKTRGYLSESVSPNETEVLVEFNDSPLLVTIMATTDTDTITIDHDMGDFFTETNIPDDGIHTLVVAEAPLEQVKRFFEAVSESISEMDIQY